VLFCIFYPLFKKFVDLEDNEICNRPCRGLHEEICIRQTVKAFLTAFNEREIGKSQEEEEFVVSNC
jgi:hypothetical protein